ncbi:ATP-binding cassette domain-containing protein [Nonomuraea sp. NPDC049784]|uniref:ATP-binding cassette domain-containing protein n=1 Tax=Nonomuraea sp. NPDC049784 TaxID=3154361 RepID=UPI0033E58C7C
MAEIAAYAACQRALVHLGQDADAGGNGPSWKRTPIDEVYAAFPVLHEMRRRLAEALSGGQQQMLAVGWALMCRPKVMLLDEHLPRPVRVASRRSPRCRGPAGGSA